MSYVLLRAAALVVVMCAASVAPAHAAFSGVDSAAAPKNPPPRHQTSQPQFSETFIKLASDFLEAFNADDYITAGRVGAEMIQMEADFAQTPAELREVIIVYTIFGAFDSQMYEEVVALGRDHPSVLDVQPDAHELYVISLVATAQYAAAAPEIIRYISRVDQESADGVSELVYIVATHHTVSSESRHELLLAVHRVGLIPDNNVMRRFRIREYMAAGDIVSAQQDLEAITEPYALLSFYALPEFDPLFEGEDRSTVFAANIHRVLEESRTRAMASDASIDDLTSYASLLLFSYEARTLIGLGQQWEPLLDQPSTHEDYASVSWLFDTVARAHFTQGDLAEAERIQRINMDRGEVQGDSVSFRINLAYLLLRTNRAQDSLDLLRDIEDSGLSPYGEAQAQSIRAQANFALGKNAQAESSLSRLAELRYEDPLAYVGALIGMEREDEAAAFFIYALRYIDDHPFMALAVQTAPAGFYEAMLSEGVTRPLQRLLERPDVAAAVDQYVHRLDMSLLASPPQR